MFRRKKSREKKENKKGIHNKMSDDHYKSDFNNLVFDKKIPIEMSS